MKTIVFSLLILTVSLFVSPTESFAQSEHAKFEATNLFKKETPKFWEIVEKLEKSKTTKAKIRSLDEFQDAFESFWSQLKALEKKHLELGKITETESLMFKFAEDYWKSIDKFGEVFKNILDKEKDDKMLVKAFNDFKSRMNKITSNEE